MENQGKWKIIKNKISTNSLSQIKYYKSLADYLL